MAHDTLIREGIPQPKIAVCMNPHAGEMDMEKRKRKLSLPLNAHKVKVYRHSVRCPLTRFSSEQ
ncbi:hypothetical protein CHCC14820_1368 [Bacillus paralicheniformis]|uniref:Uncharacterized protein n=1 Tax=Bacillus licheniformis TaxID=1402 RepID=A0A8B5YFY8_BACLI|nr:hypothetical protein MUY_003629 [Bacillus licheniformis WX-02]AMR11926.1 hypothetical protein AB684_17790 [Bacillus licheniformis]EQM26293.1 hypothetical protein N399_19100 [Bacillus licheniformis CG-B52]TWM34265.1 hypothetical protein CHCC14820_1368 [Bacillus paralicheniformis]TWN10669.1 hypothetical protein CHCC14564_3221 [Bacillus licheniformis LMG 17339]